MRSEHIKGRCFGVVKRDGAFYNCGCSGHMDPYDPPRYVREGEEVRD